MRLPLATSLKTRTGAPSGKDARLNNAYVEMKGDVSAVRSRPTAHGGVSVGSGTAQGGYGTVLFWGDTAYTIDSNTGTTWSSSTGYLAGDHVAVDFVDYWALTNNTNSNPTSNPSDWTTSYSPQEPISLSWAAQTLPVSSAWYSIAWNGTIFCTIATGTSIAATSTDGASWTQRTLPASADWTDIASDGTKFCIVDTNSNLCATSTDGITWNTGTFPIGNLPKICYGASKWVGGGGNNIVTSSDGLTWSSSSALPSSSGTEAVKGLVYNGTVFCVVTNTGGSSAGNYAAYSSDGSSWTAVTMPQSVKWYDLAWNGSVFCAIAKDTNVAAISSDGANWTQVTMPSSAAWYAITARGGVFCAIAYGGTTSAISRDGITWTTHTLPSTANWIDIASDGSKFCAVAISSNKASTGVLV